MPARVTKDGRVTIPKWVREHLGIKPGTEIAFRRAADGSIVIERAGEIRAPGRFAKLVGIAGSGPSTDEIMKPDLWRGSVGHGAAVIPADAGYPVRRGLSFRSLTSLEYWIARRSLSSGGHSADPVAGDDSGVRFSRRAIRARFSFRCALKIRRARGNAGCTLHPRARAHVHRKVRTRAYRTAEALRHSLRNGFTAYDVISPVNGFLATVVCGT